MFLACFVILLNMSGQKNAISVSQINAIEDRTDRTRIFMNRDGLNLDAKDNFETVLKKIEQAKSLCRVSN